MPGAPASALTRHNALAPARHHSANVPKSKLHARLARTLTEATLMHPRTYKRPCNTMPPRPAGQDTAELRPTP